MEPLRDCEVVDPDDFMTSPIPRGEHQKQAEEHIP